MKCLLKLRFKFREHSAIELPLDISRPFRYRLPHGERIRGQGLSVKKPIRTLNPVATAPGSVLVDPLRFPTADHQSGVLSLNSTCKNSGAHY